MLKPGDLAEARRIQSDLAESLVQSPSPVRPLTLAAFDCAPVKASGAVNRSEVLRASILSMAYPSMECLDYAQVEGAPEFPYRTGFLSFREAPLLLDAFERLRHRPDLLLVDGAGILHPRGLGLAAHLGVLLDLPSIGVAKSYLLGEYRDPAQEKGAWEPIFVRGKIMGACLRTRARVQPLFVSPGHRMDVASARLWVFATLGRYRLPDPIRWVDALSKGRSSWCTLPCRKD